MTPPSDAPLTPDEIEQRQSAGPDGEVEETDVPDRPLDPDELEQRQDVGWDEDDERPA